MLLTAKLIIISLCLLLAQVTIGASVVHVNETVGDFKISFNAKDEINMIAKYWNITGSGIMGNEPDLHISSAYMVVAGNLSDPNKRWSGVVIFVTKEPINVKDTEKNYFKNSTSRYIKTYDRIIDGHRGVLARTGNSSKDPLMNYTALYWLDEKNGTATRLVASLTQEPWNEGGEMMVNTTHVEEISKED